MQSHKVERFPMLLCSVFCKWRGLELHQRNKAENVPFGKYDVWRLGNRGLRLGHSVKGLRQCLNNHEYQNTE